MMKTLMKFLIVLIGVFASVYVQAQVNTGTKPYVGSTHSYHVDQSSLPTTTLTWSVVGGTASDYEFVGGVNTGEDVSIIWKTASVTPYILKVEEVRTDIAAACATTRQISVTVSDNNFDIYAELSGTLEACATVVDPVVDAGTLGDNSDDTFGLTTREYKVKAYNLATNPATSNTVAWNYTFTLVNVKTGTTTDEGLAVDISVDGSSSTSGSTINVGEGTVESTVTVSYTTNNKRQDADLDLVLEITAGEDAIGTIDNDGKSGSSNTATYLVRAVPATTGITTD